MARDLIREAHHEAGHAVAVHLLGRRIDFVRLGRDSGENSECKTSGDWIGDRDLEQGLLDWICWSMAGPAADRWCVRDKLRDGTFSFLGWKGDVFHALDKAGMVVGNRGTQDGGPPHTAAVYQVIAEQRRRADALVRPNWRAVTAIASRLPSPGTALSGDEVHAIINRELGRPAG